jgi:hypothetical protein
MFWLEGAVGRVGGLLDDFAHELAWYQVAIERAEVVAIRYIDWDW